jgi:hypothetical protein
MKRNFDSKRTFKQAGYTYIKNMGNKSHLLIGPEGITEVWVCNKNHASYGLIYKNTHLEFAHCEHPSCYSV